MKLKRLVSAVLAIGMALTILPTAAFAAGNTIGSSEVGGLEITEAGYPKVPDETPGSIVVNGVTVKKLFDFTEHVARFSTYPYWFFRFASAAFRSHSFRRPLALKYNTTSPAFCQHFFASFLSFFYISQKECFRAGFEPLRNGHGHFVSPLPRGEPLQFPGWCYII